MKIRKIDPRIKATIAAFGFTEDQIEIYFAGLELGTTTAEELSKRSKLDIEKTKEVLISLMTNNTLVEEMVIKGIVLYRVVPFEDVFISRN